MVELGIYKQSYLNQLHTRDPFPGYDNLPQSQNGYSYVQDNPVNYTDPSGHCVVLAGVDLAICVTAAAALTVFVANNAIQNNALLDDAIEDLAYMASNAWDDLSCWLSDIGGSADDVEKNPLLELAGNTASSPGDFDPNDFDETNFVQRQGLGAPSRPSTRYQTHVTGKNYEEVWKTSDGKIVQLDAINDGYVVEVKWTGQNNAAWRSSPAYHPQSPYYNEGNILDQVTRQLRFARESGLKGVRYVVSTEEAQGYYEALFQKQFPNSYGSDFLRVWHVPGSGM